MIIIKPPSEQSHDLEVVHIVQVIMACDVSGSSSSCRGRRLTVVIFMVLIERCGAKIAFSDVMKCRESGDGRAACMGAVSSTVSCCEWETTRSFYRQMAAAAAVAATNGCIFYCREEALTLVMYSLARDSRPLRSSPEINAPQHHVDTLI